MYFQAVLGSLGLRLSEKSLARPLHRVPRTTWYGHQGHLEQLVKFFMRNPGKGESERAAFESHVYHLCL